jgi:hypothetical protein
MLSPPKLVGMFLTQSVHDGDRSQLRLLGEPVLNRNNMRVELGGQVKRVSILCRLELFE